MALKKKCIYNTLSPYKWMIEQVSTYAFKNELVSKWKDVTDEYNNQRILI